MLKSRIKSFLSWLKIYKNIFKESPPIYTNGNDIEGIKIHVGSGIINLQGWLNIDAREFSHTHIKTEELDLKEFNNNAVHKIYMCHVLEHFSFEENKKLLKNFYTKLAKGGVLMISVPDFNALVQIYLKSGKNLNKIKNALMGGQDYEYNFHKSVFDKDVLRLLFNECGFKDIEEWNTKNEFGKSIGDWSDYLQKVKGFKIPISLNLKGIKR